MWHGEALRDQAGALTTRRTPSGRRSALREPLGGEVANTTGT
jgi:hypothetical protein